MEEGKKVEKKTIKGFPDYSIDTNGVVYSSKRGVETVKNGKQVTTIEGNTTGGPRS